MQTAASAEGDLHQPYAHELSAEAIANRYVPRVHRFAVLVSPPPADPDDVAQQAILKALEQMNRFDPRRGSLESWLWRLVVNAARDAGRVARRRELLIEQLVRTHRTALMASPENLALDSLRDEQLVAAVRRLPVRYRSLIALRYGAGLGMVEVAAALGITRMAAAKGMRRALDRLRSDLTEPEEHE